MLGGARMNKQELEDAVNDAVAILGCVQSLLAEARKDITVEADGLYMLLGCVINRLKRAPAWAKDPSAG